MKTHERTVHKDEDDQEEEDDQPKRKRGKLVNEQREGPQQSETAAEVEVISRVSSCQ